MKYKFCLLTFSNHRFECLQQLRRKILACCTATPRILTFKSLQTHWIGDLSFKQTVDGNPQGE